MSFKPGFMDRRLMVVVATTLLLCGSVQAQTAPRVKFSTTAGDFVLELYPDKAPKTVENFLQYVRDKHYDGTIFHRVIKSFVIQGGGFTSDLKERAKIDEAAGRKDVPIVNEWQNGLKNIRGAIAMARDSAPDTATREFYINVMDNPKLDTPRETTGKAGYAVFGHVVKGMDIVDRIREGATMARPDVIVDGEGMKDVPVQPVVIQKVTMKN